MRTEAWSQLFVQLASATAQGRAEWRSSEAGGAYVLSRPSGVIVLREISDAAVGSHYLVAILDPDGKELDTIRLGYPGTTGAAGDPMVVAANHQLMKLIEAIRAQGDLAERVAKAIIDELEAPW